MLQLLKTITLMVLVALSAEFCYGQNLGELGKQPPVTLTGSVQLTGIFYNASGIPNRQLPFTSLLSGSPTLNIYGVAIPFNFILSAETRTVQQPFNQFGISPQYKWITLHLGYRSLNFSPYTMAGYTMFGAGIELTPDKFRFGFIYGRLNKGTKLDTSTQSLVPYSFTRKAYAAKIGYGSPTNFFELSYLRGKDDASSGPQKIDSLTQLVLAEANTVAGASARFTFFKKLYIAGNVGASIYTDDINSRVPIDSTNELIKAGQKIAIINGTTQYFLAYDGTLGFQNKKYGLKLQFVHIDPGYKSFGAYFFENDVQRYSIAPSLRLFKNRLRFNGSVGFQNDDVKKQKQAENHRVISNSVLSADVTRQFGFDINYINYSDNQQPQTILFADSLRIAQTTQNLSITPHLYLSNKTTTNSIYAGTTQMRLSDFNTSYSQNSFSRNIRSQQYFINYTYGYLPRKLNVYLSLNAIKMAASGITDQNTGFTLGATKVYLKSALRVSANVGFSKDLRNDGASNVLTSSGNIKYVFFKRNSFGLLYYYTNNQPKSAIALYPAFSETRVEASYNYNFR